MSTVFQNLGLAMIAAAFVAGAFDGNQFRKPADLLIVGFLCAGVAAFTAAAIVAFK